MSKSEPAVLLDTSLLLLVSVGQFDNALIGRRRLDIYTLADFDVLASLIGSFLQNLTTPHVLAEVSNLADQCVPKPRHREFREFFGDFVKHLNEHWTPADRLCQTEPFRRLGLADAAICHLVSEQTTVISADVELCDALWSIGVNAQNFNHLRIR